MERILWKTVLSSVEKALKNTKHFSTLFPQISKDERFTTITNFRRLILKIIGGGKKILNKSF